jgi:mannose-6-phosphate isomerase-like protein (cupin superfamily)
MENSQPSPAPYAVERRARHLVRPGFHMFHISELQIGSSQEVPWHYHKQVSDTFYVLEGRIRITLRDPDEEVFLDPGQSFVAAVRRPHRVRNAGTASASFLVLQGIGPYDFISVA